MDSSSTGRLALFGLGGLALGAALGYYAGYKDRSNNKESPVIPINDLDGPRSNQYSEAEREARCSLAALYRMVDNLGWSERIYNHISVSFRVETNIVSAKQIL